MLDVMWQPKLMYQCCHLASKTDCIYLF